MTLKDLPLWWQQRPLREKLLLSCVSVLALAGLGDALVTAPLEKKLKRTGGEIAALVAKIDSMQLAESGGVANAPPLREQEARLREKLQAVQTQHQALQQRVSEAARLPETLRAVVATVGSARLLELDLAGDSEAAAAPASTGHRLYRLPITLKVSGNWAELQTLLGQIERHAQALQWQTLTLDNSEWPAIQLTLKAHVLSLQPRWGAAS
jgi:DNA repair exonuclease SbcCD ATPase subunit